MARLRVVAWVHGLYPHLRAGSETMLADMLEALADAGHEVHAVADSTGPEDGSTSWEYQGVQCWRETPSAAGDFVAMLEPDVIVSHHHIGTDAIAAAKRLGAAVAVVLHNDFKWTRNMINARPDLLVFNTHWLHRKMGTRGIPYLVVHPTLHADRYALPGGAPSDGAVTMSNLDKNKGPDIFYHVARALPDVPFLAVRGAYGKQDERAGYPNVEFMDPVTDVTADVLARSRMVLVPSRYESYGRFAVEALAAGLPVVATGTAGLRESLAYAGLFASRGNPAEWVRIVRRHLEDPAMWARASKAAAVRASELDAMRREELARWASAVGAAGRAARTARARRAAPTGTA